ncbi:type II toxin-antitoxin system VapC family toxin [Candidatus Saccharibacteria bacterium]|nr:type II toxin-antitoxin system VapC family toxin [Candidatus Saccharibacteria bacterium]
MPKSSAPANTETGNPKAPIFLLDTNAVQSFLGDATAPLLRPTIEEIKEVGGILAVSDIVLYEALKSIVFKPKKLRSITAFIDEYLTRFTIDEDVLISAAQLYEIYGDEPACRPYRDKFSTEDIIIATTSVLTGAYILTSDCNDFPAPFFLEVNRQTFYYYKGHRRKHLILHLLQPDNGVINDALEKLSAG